MPALTAEIHLMLILLIPDEPANVDVFIFKGLPKTMGFVTKYQDKGQKKSHLGDQI